MHGDAVTMLKETPDAIADVFLFDPPYPHIQRPYGMLTEDEWHDLMKSVLEECKRILKPTGSVVVIIQPNYETLGRMRIWPYEFVCWAHRMWPDWGLVEDAYSSAPNPLPCAGATSQHGLLRRSIKWCVWLGPADCYRDQDAVLMAASECMRKQRRTDDQQPKYDGGATVRRAAFEQTFRERGGVTPLNLFRVPIGTPIDRHEHPAVTPYRLAEWWCKYLLPSDGVLIDCFCGSGTTLLAGLNCGASKVIGIDKEEEYLDLARRRIFGDEAAPTLSSSSLSSKAERSHSKGQWREPVWRSGSNLLALQEVEQWKGRKLTVLEEAIHRFFADKSWCVGGPIPLRLLYGADSMSLVRDADQHGGLQRAGDLLGQDALGQLTDQMTTRGIRKEHHGGLSLLYLRLCRGLEVASEQPRLAS
jgi:16S rRNA G966 N2-methylase RsmD